MELGLPLKAYGSHGFKGKSVYLCEMGRYSQGRGCLCFLFQLRGHGRLRGIQIRWKPFKITFNLLFCHNFPIGPDSGFIGKGVCGCLLQLFNQVMVNDAVLACYFCSGILGLAAGNLVCFQYNHINALLLKKVGGQNPGHARANHGRLHGEVSGQGVPGRQVGCHAPD